MSNKPGSCQIHFNEPQRITAAVAAHPVPPFQQEPGAEYERHVQLVQEYQLKYADELQAQREFTGPHFKDCVAEVRFEEGFVHVTLTGDAPGTTYSYPASSVARVKSYRS